MIKSQNPSTQSETCTKIYDCELCKDKEYTIEEIQGEFMAVPCKCKERKAFKRMIANSGLTPMQLKYKLSDFKPSKETAGMLAMVKKYLTEYPKLFKEPIYNKGMAFTGTVGTGKTMLATIIANEFLRQRIPTIFTVTPTLISELLSSQFDDSLNSKIYKLSTVEVVIFDDLGREKPSEWVRSQYYKIIDARYSNYLPTLFTSNYSFDEIGQEERLGDAVASRLYSLTKGRQVNIQAKDYRIFGS